MSIIGSDRSGPRIQCRVFKESGACRNGSRFYIEKIEQLVVDALRLQLSNPKLIREYVKAYRDERIGTNPRHDLPAFPIECVALNRA